MKLKNWLSAIGIATLALSFASCSEESLDNTKVVGEWLPTHEKYFIDGKEIPLEDGQCIYIYNGIDVVYYRQLSKNSDFGFLSMTFYSGSRMEFCGFPAKYSVNGNQIICTMYGEDTILSIEVEYIVDSEEETITGYMIKEEIEEWPFEEVIDDKRDGIERVLKVSTFYSKVN